MNAKTNRDATFVRGNDRLDEILSRPEVAARVDQVHAESLEMDRTAADSLAMIRRAGDLTQVDIAEKLGVGQAGVSRIERRHDMLLSTLADYLQAAGAEHARIVVDINGREVELDLAKLRQTTGKA